MFPFHQSCMVVVTGCQVASHSDNGIYVFLPPVVCTVVDDGDCHHYANSPSNVTMENMFLYCKPNSNHRKGSGACCQFNSYVKYPASSSYHLTRLVFMKTSSPHTFNAFLTLATARRRSFATGGTFSNSRALLQFTATLTTMLLTRDARKGDHHSKC